MISYIKSMATAGGLYFEGVCSAEDAFPIEGVANGSTLRELNVDTGVVTEHIFDKEHGSWIQIGGGDDQQNAQDDDQ